MRNGFLEEYKELDLSVTNLDALCFDLKDAFKQKEIEWMNRSEACEEKLNALRRDSNDGASNDVSRVPEKVGTLPCIIKNMPPSLLQEILDDQKDANKSSRSIEELKDSISLTMSKKEMLHEREEKQTQKKVSNDIETTSLSDESNYY